MKIKDRPEFKSKPRPVVLQAGQSVAEAVKVMAERNIGSVVIVEEPDRVVGILTERDLLRRLLYHERDQATTKVADIMTSEVRVARAEDEVVDWLRQMSNDRFRHLPVVDGEGKLVAMMSQGDFVSYTWPEMLLQVKETAKRIYLRGPQITMIVAVLILYLVAVLVIAAERV